jgi:carboxymethylenebutenolidase
MFFYARGFPSVGSKERAAFGIVMNKIWARNVRHAQACRRCSRPDPRESFIHQKEDIMGEHISLTCKDGQKIGAYVAKPTGTAKGAVVVLQEIFGANQHIRKTADLYASNGYLAIAPALYDRVEPDVELGYTGDDPKKGMEIRAKTELPKTLLDIEAAIDHVKGAGKVGVVGYCWGGSLTFAAACKLPGVAAASGYYGGQIAATMLDLKPAAPIILHFGENDHGIPLTDVEKIKAAFPDVPVYVYPGAGHGFNCDERASFQKEAADLARTRTLDFFAKQL